MFHVPTFFSQKEDSLAWLKVIHVNESYFWAELISENTCVASTCGASGTGCQTNAFARLLTKQPLLKFSQPVHKTLMVNDEVLVAISQHHILHLSLWVYGASLLALILGIAIGQSISGDWLGLLFGCFSLVMSWSILNRQLLALQPHIKEVKHTTEILK